MADCSTNTVTDSTGSTSSNDGGGDSSIPSTVTSKDIVENQYSKQEQMMEEIAQQIKQQQALTSAIIPVSSLRLQYAENPNFIIGINILEQSYTHIRTIRGDGNCYYRAFLYNLLEILLQQKQQQLHSEGQRLLHYVTTKSWEDILQQNYDEVAIEIFHDEMIELFNDVIVKSIYIRDNDDSKSSSSNNNNNNNNDHHTTTSETTKLTLFHNKMNEENSVSDYCTWYLRLITATYMKQDPDRFIPFLLSIMVNNNNNDTFDDMVVPTCDIHQFCSKYIEPMGQECEHVQVLALAEAFQIHVTVVYLDGHHSPLSSKNTTSTDQNNSGHQQLQHHHFGPDTSPIKLTLLYRPGHYDILYKL